MAAKFSFGDVQYSALNHTPGTRRMWSFLLFLLALVSATSLFVIYYLFPFNTDPTNTDPINTHPINTDSINPPPDHCAVTGNTINEKKKILGKNWIVVTTVNDPTDAMDLLCNLERWNVRTPLQAG